MPKPEPEAPTLDELATEFETFGQSVDEQLRDRAEGAQAITPWAGGPPEKRDRVADYIFRLEAEADYYHKKAEAFERKARTRRMLAMNLRFALKSFMELRGIEKAEGHNFTFAVRRNPGAVKVIRVEDIPDSYFRTERVPDIQKIREALLMGEEVPGVVLNETTRLEVK